MNIRAIKSEDIIKVANIYRQAFNSVTNDGWNEITSRRLIKYLSNHQSAIFLVAEEGGQIYGAVFGEIRPWAKGNSIRDIELFVTNNKHGKGIGKQLLRAILREARDKYGVNEVSFLADSGKGFPFSWYKKIGMKDYSWVFMSGGPDEVIEKLQ